MESVERTRMSFDSKFKQLQLVSDELQRLRDHSKMEKVREILTTEIGKVEAEIVSLNRLAKAAVDASDPIKNSAARCYDVRLTNYAWDQSEKFVKIYVTLKGLESLDEMNVECVFTERSFTLKVNGLDGRNYVLNICNLLEKISVSASFWKKKGDTLVISLSKQSRGNWSHMTSVEKKANEPKTPKLNHSEDPSAGLMDMMRQMYQDGDDEMKRTIAKAWTESRDKQLPD